MKPKLLWIIAAILVVCFLWVQALILAYTQMYFDWMFTALEVIVNFVLIVGISSGLGSLLALIPFRRKSYKQKFGWAIPAALIVMTGLFLYVFGSEYLWMKKSGRGTGYTKPYEKVETSSVGNCSLVHNGYFKCGKLLIERNGDRQVQWEENSSKKDAFKVDWVSDCEYHLTNVDSPASVLKVKITNATIHGYRCYVSYSSELAVEYILRNIDSLELNSKK